MVIYERILTYIRESFKKGKEILQWKFIKENIVSSFWIGVVFTISHELFVDIFYHGKIIFFDFIDLASGVRLLIIIIISSIILTFFFFKKIELKKKDEKNANLMQVLIETGKMAKVGGWEVDLITDTQTWTPGIYFIVELDLPEDKNEPLKRVNFYTPESNAILKPAVKKLITLGESYDLDLELITAKGNHRWVRTIGKGTKINGKVVSISGVIQDITDIKLATEALHESEKNYKMLSSIDGLTRLYNRRHFDEHLKMEIDRATRYDLPLTILFIDIDNFKNFNDSYGHCDGDKVLSLFGKIVVRCIRTVDIAHRYGGEEFTVMLPSTNLEKGCLVAEKIKETFNQEIITITSDQKVSMTISIGVAEYIRSESPEDFIKRADVCMYEAKRTGKNKVCF